MYRFHVFLSRQEKKPFKVQQYRVEELRLDYELIENMLNYLFIH